MKIVPTLLKAVVPTGRIELQPLTLRFLILPVENAITPLAPFSGEPYIIAAP